jgi:hypothetical protein
MRNRSDNLNRYIAGSLGSPIENKERNIGRRLFAPCAMPLLSLGSNPNSLMSLAAYAMSYPTWIAFFPFLQEREKGKEKIQLTLLATPVGAMRRSRYRGPMKCLPR